MDVKRIEDSNISAWDKLYRSTEKSIWGEAPFPYLEDVIGKIEKPILKSSNLLDAATGEGRNLSCLISTEANVFACDVSPSAISKIDDSLKQKVEIDICSLDKTPYISDFFDLILLWDVVETLPQPQKVLHELYRILRRGGHLICNIPDLDDGILEKGMRKLCQGIYLYKEAFYYRFYSKIEAHDLLKGIDFKINSIKEYEWIEQPHPRYRNYEHVHRSRVFTVSK